MHNNEGHSVETARVTANMPIRFRCEHCQQLLGIARRKAGMHVSCPTCRRQVLVPAKDQEEAHVPAAAPPGQSPPLFERDDFDALLRPPPSMVSEAPAPRHNHALAPPPAPRPEARTEYPAPEQEWPAGDGAGLVLSPARATALTVAVILLLAVAFGAGLLVGRFYL
jgi:phage FluMu protein Com